MTADRLSDEQYDELLTVVYGSNIRSEVAGAVLTMIREHRQLMAERAETARLRAALERIADREPIDALDQFQAVPAMQAIARAALNE